MAKRNDTFTPSGANGPDPTRNGLQWDENKEWYRNLQNENSVAGDGNKSGRQFQDADDLVTFEGFNVIEHGQSAAFNQPERTTVSVDRADRGRES